MSAIETNINVKIAYTIGHSNHSLEYFFELVKRYNIINIVDVRSYPFSKYAFQFNFDNLKHTINDIGFRYLFLGDQLGGRPESPEFYDENGFVLYDKLAESSNFKRGIEALEIAIEQNLTVILCSEENPINCHRRLLIGNVLLLDGYYIMHIRGDGNVISEVELSKQENNDEQLTLFNEVKKKAWKSSQSVLQKKGQSIFSDY